MQYLKLSKGFSRRGGLLLAVWFALLAPTVFPQENGYWDDRFSLPGVVNGTVKTIIVAGNDLYAGGYFNAPGKKYPANIARWNRATESWTALGGGFGGTVEALAISGNELYACGRGRTNDATYSTRVAKWDISKNTWTTLANEISGYVGAIAVIDSSVYVAGTFDQIDDVRVNNIARWDGNTWSALKAGIQGSVHTLAVLDKNLYAGGNFDSAGELLQNYPNPFNPTTLIRFGLPQDAEVKLEILNLAGRHVATLLNARQAAGYHDVEFNAGDLASGVYFYRLTARNFRAMKKLTLVR